VVGQPDDKDHQNSGEMGINVELVGSGGPTRLVLLTWILEQRALERSFPRNRTCQFYFVSNTNHIGMLISAINF
jgi:hypothetical protein